MPPGGAWVAWCACGWCAFSFEVQRLIYITAFLGINRAAERAVTKAIGRESPPPATGGPSSLSFSPGWCEDTAEAWREKYCVGGHDFWRPSFTELLWTDASLLPFARDSKT